MNRAFLANALRACASGIYTAEAAVGMLAAHATWLERDDFARFVLADPLPGWPPLTGPQRSPRSRRENCPARAASGKGSGWPPAWQAGPRSG